MTPKHDERLTAPLPWWLAAVGFGLVCAWLMYVATTPTLAVVAGAIGIVVGGLIVVGWGALRIRVDDELHAGRAHIGPKHVGAVEVLDHATYREVMGPRADVRAWLATRPWIDQGVRVVIDDPSDPHPYWLVGSRRPQQLAAAIEDLRQTGRRSADDGAPQKGA